MKTRLKVRSIIVGILGVSLVIVAIGSVVSLNQLYNDNAAENERLAALSAKAEAAANAPTVDGLLELTNKERADAGVPALELDERLNGSAQQKADDMANNNYFAHVNPVTKKNGPDYAKEATNGTCIWVSENIVRDDFPSSKSIIWDFMQSKPHREALLDPKYTSVGFGINGKYVAQHFCQAAN